MEMKRVVAHTPRNGAILGSRSLVVSLAFDTEVPTRQYKANNKIAMR
jgi:hypothetical protein